MTTKSLPVAPQRVPTVGEFHHVATGRDYFSDGPLNFYKRHIGDYARDTAHLSIAEHGAYLLMLQHYYATEKPIPQDLVYAVTRARTAAGKAATDSVLRQFFKLESSGFRSERCDQEIEKMKKTIEANRKNGANGGRPKSEQNQLPEEPIGLDSANPNGTQTEPIPIASTPITNGKAIGSAKKQPTRRFRLPEDFYPNESGIAKAKDSGLDVKFEFQKFSDYHRGKGTVMADWDAAWRTWTTNAVQYRKGNSHGPTIDEQRAATRKAMYGGLDDRPAIDGEAERVD